MKTKTIISKLVNILPLILLSFIALPSQAQLNGSYTINPSLKASTTNYQTIRSAFSDLDSGKRADGGTVNGIGVSGPVIFKIADGTYFGGWSLKSIKGASLTNTITVESASGDSSKVILQDSTTPNYIISFAVILLNGAKYLTFKNLTVQLTDTNEFGACVDLRNGAANNSFLNDRFIGIKKINKYIMGFIDLYSSDDSNILINNCLIRNCNDAIHLQLGSNASGITITNNTIDSFADAGVSITGGVNPLVSNNLITHLPLWGTGGGGIDIESITGPFRILNNKVIARKNFYTLYFQDDLNTTASPSLIANNFVTQGDTTIFGGGYGLMIYQGCKGINVIHNNFYQGNNSTYSGVYLGDKNDKIKIYNNNFVSYGSSGLRYDQSLTTKNVASDYNNFYGVNAKYYFAFGGSGYSDLSTYSSISGSDAHSKNIDPGYLSDSDLHIVNNKLNAGKFFSTVPKDIDGEWRNTKKPTIGADELPTQGCYAAFKANYTCLGDSISTHDTSTFIGQDTIKQWLWNFGDGKVSSLQNPKHLYLTGGTYQVTLKIMAKSGIVDSAIHPVTIYSNCLKILKGIVDASTNKPLKTSKIYLCNYHPGDTIVNIEDSTITDTLGAYSFTTRDTLTYLVAFPDITIYPHEMPTWADTGLYFPLSSSIALRKDTTVKNFTTIYGINPGGSGSIGGIVNYCFLCKTYGSGGPASGIRMILTDSNGKAQKYTYTDNKGNFNFNNLAIEKYKVFVDMPLVKNSPAPSIVLTSFKPNMDSLSFTLYPTYLSMNVITTGINPMEPEATSIVLEPNPATNTLNCKLENFSGPYSLKIDDLSGREQYSQLFNSPTASIDVSFLQSGIYILHFYSGSTIITRKFVKTN